MERIRSKECPMCLNTMDLAGHAYYINQLFPGRHVTKLPHCSHSVHTACFQKYIDTALGPRQNEGQVGCPQCRQEVLSVHSSIKIKGIEKKIRVLKTAVGMLVLGRIAENFKENSLSNAGLLLAAYIGMTFFMDRLLSFSARTYYNHLFGMNLKEIDLILRSEVKRSQDMWLGMIYDNLNKIQLKVNGHSFMLDPETDIITCNRSQYIEKMKKQLGDIQENSPFYPLIDKAGLHFHQIFYLEGEDQTIFCYKVMELMINEKMINFQFILDETKMDPEVFKTAQTAFDFAGITYVKPNK